MRHGRSLRALIASVGAIGVLALLAAAPGPAMTRPGTMSSHAAKPKPAKPTIKPDFAFFKGKTITYIVPNAAGTPAGNTFVAMQPALEKYLGATINIIYNSSSNILGMDQVSVAKNDGLTLGMMFVQSILFQNFTPNSANVNFDVLHSSYIGSTGAIAPVYVACPGSPKIESLTQLNSGAVTANVIVNSTGISGMELKLLFGAYGWPHKYIEGYVSKTQIIGCERGDGNMTLTVPGNVLTADGTAFVPGVVPLMLLGSIPATSPQAFVSGMVPSLENWSKTHQPKTVAGQKELQFLLQFASAGAPQYASFGPKGIPAARLLALQKAFAAVMKQQTVQQGYIQNGVAPLWNTPASVVKYFRQQFGHGQLIKQYMSQP